MFIILLTFKSGHPPPYLLWNLARKKSHAFVGMGSRSNRTHFSLASPCRNNTYLPIHAFRSQVFAEHRLCLGYVVKCWGHSSEQNGNLLPKELRFPWCKTGKSKSLPM